MGTNTFSWAEKINGWVASHITSLQAYPAGKPIEETKKQYGLVDVIKLASNENPLGPSPKAVEAVKLALSAGHRYPDAAQVVFREKLAMRYGLTKDHFAAGCGSNEHIDLLMRVFCSKGGHVLTHDVAFVAYSLCAQLNGVPLKTVPLNHDLSVDLDQLLGAVNEDTRLVFLANPNNPTGRYLPREQVHRLAAALLEKGVPLVLDLAYDEYVEAQDHVPAEKWVKDFSNIIVLKTFSKIYGLATMRIGYAMGSPEVMELLHKTRQPFNVSELGVVASMEALDDVDFVKRSRQVNAQGKAYITEICHQLKLTVIPSEGNFLLIDYHQPTNAFFEAYLREGVIVRPVLNYGLKTHMRVTIGTQNENVKFVKATKKILNALSAKKGDV